MKVIFGTKKYKYQSYNLTISLSVQRKKTPPLHILDFVPSHKEKADVQYLLVGFIFKTFTYISSPLGCKTYFS